MTGPGRTATRALDVRASCEVLTAREREVLDHVATGATNAQVASNLGVSPATVRKHLENAFSKLGVCTRTAAVARIAALHSTTG